MIWLFVFLGFMALLLAVGLTAATIILVRMAFKEMQDWKDE
jgi:hypothetical protein